MSERTIDIELFNEFLASAVDMNDWDKIVYPAVWGRCAEDKDGPKWEQVIEDENPYDLTPAFATIGVQDNFEAMLLMYGHMSRIVEEGEELDEEEERIRVRVMIYLNGDKPQVAVQPKGETTFIPDETLGEGIVPEMINESIRHALAMKELEDKLKIAEKFKEEKGN